jgi:DNA-binding transcriptional LysR family regulator
VNLDLDGVECFVLLAAEGHYGRAARRLSLSSSALSKRIARLEASIGTVLVERDSGGMTGLTRAGERFLQHCEELLRAARAAQHAAVQTENPALVRLGVPGSPTDHFPLAAWQIVSLALGRIVPTSRIQLRPVPYAWIENSLLSGWIDVLLTSAFVDHPDLVSTSLGATERVLHLPRGHTLAEAGKATVSSVTALRLILEPTAPAYWMSPWILGDVLGTSATRTVEVVAKSIRDIDRAVSLGVGTSVFSALTPLVDPHLVSVPITDAPPLPFYAVKRKRDERDSVMGLLNTLCVLAATIAVRDEDPSLASPRTGPDSWWVTWVSATMAGPARLRSSSDQ